MMLNVTEFECVVLVFEDMAPEQTWMNATTRSIYSLDWVFQFEVDWMGRWWKTDGILFFLCDGI
jgi:hypothetical protein